jgi:hypothetical protein
MTDEGQPARNGFGKGGGPFAQFTTGRGKGMGKGWRGMIPKALQTFTVKACLLGKQAEFEKQLSDEINSLGFKEVSVSVTWPARDVGRGQIKFSANWQSKRSRGVKREREPTLSEEHGNKADRLLMSLHCSVSANFTNLVVVNRKQRRQQLRKIHDIACRLYAQKSER